jgi:hypothetical protein
MAYQPLHDLELVNVSQRKEWLDTVFFQTLQMFQVKGRK